MRKIILFLTAVSLSWFPMVTLAQEGAKTDEPVALPQSEDSTGAGSGNPGVDGRPDFEGDGQSHGTDNSEPTADQPEDSSGADRGDDGKMEGDNVEGEVLEGEGPESAEANAPDEEEEVVEDDIVLEDEAKASDEEQAAKDRKREEEELADRWFCEATPIFKENGLFVTIPAALGGCFTEFAGLPYSIPVAIIESLKRKLGDPEAENFHFNQVSGIFNALGSGFFGFPFFAIKKVAWDYPLRKLFPTEAQRKEDEDISVEGVPDDDEDLKVEAPE